MYLEFIDSEYKIAAQGLTVELFPKEYALLVFLYRNRGRTFNREQLLDKVWPLEYPVERTVDDHIYRLRKKLVKFKELEIRTVRGYGYSLSVHDSTFLTEAQPTTRDLELRETMRAVFVKYHKYGQGKSMLTLARQRDVLGYELDPFYSTYVHFVQGDIEWLLNTDEVPLTERVYWLLLYVMFLGEPEKKIRYCEQALEKKLLSPSQHREMEILNIVDLYTLAGDTDRALERLEISYKVIDESELEGFYLPTAITEMFVHLMAGAQDDDLSRMANSIEVLLLEKPFLRELGSYKVIKGLWLLRSKEWREAESLLDEGLRVLEMSGFAPLRMHALYRINYCLLHIPIKEELQLKYINLYEEEQEQLGLNRLAISLEAALVNILNVP